MHVKHLLLLALILASCNSQTQAAESTFEGPLAPFLGEPALNISQVQNRQRFPNVVVTNKGTIIAIYQGVKCKRSEDAGKTWGEEITIGKGFMGGGVIVDETTGHILAFVEGNHPPAPMTIYKSKDDGKSWQMIKYTIKPDANGNIPSMHMNDSGITLRHGKHKGRLIRATRHYAGQNHRSKWPQHYTNAMYSDDHGTTWQTCKPFADMGTGEAALAELSDGTLYYNSRAHWYKNQDKEPPLRRRSAYSADGGETWTDWKIVQVLPDGPQNTNYGCMGGLTRLPIAGKDILIYSNCDSKGGRKQGTMWASFDGGKSWPIKRLVTEGAFAYSSLNAGRPNTNTQGLIFCHFEGGGSKVATFNLSWILKGEKTGDGKVPGWLSK